MSAATIASSQPFCSSSIICSAIVASLMPSQPHRRSVHRALILNAHHDSEQLQRKVQVLAMRMRIPMLRTVRSRLAGSLRRGRMGSTRPFPQRKASSIGNSGLGRRASNGQCRVVVSVCYLTKRPTSSKSYIQKSPSNEPIVPGFCGTEQGILCSKVA